MRKRNANIILSRTNIPHTFFRRSAKNITYFFVPDFFMLCAMKSFRLEYSLLSYRESRKYHRRVPSPKLARDDRMLRSRDVHFRELGQAADDPAARPFRAAIGTQDYPELDGSIVIKSIGSYCIAPPLLSRMLHGLNSVSRNGADRSIHRQDALWSA